MCGEARHKKELAVDPHQAGCLYKGQRGSSNDAESPPYKYKEDRVLYTGALVEEEEVVGNGARILLC